MKPNNDENNQEHEYQVPRNDQNEENSVVQTNQNGNLEKSFEFFKEVAEHAVSHYLFEKFGRFVGGLFNNRFIDAGGHIFGFISALLYTPNLNENENELLHEHWERQGQARNYERFNELSLKELVGALILKSKKDGNGKINLLEEIYQRINKNGFDVQSKLKSPLNKNDYINIQQLVLNMLSDNSDPFIRKLFENEEKLFNNREIVRKIEDGRELFQTFAGVIELSARAFFDDTFADQIHNTLPFGIDLAFNTILATSGVPGGKLVLINFIANAGNDYLRNPNMNQHTRIQTLNKLYNIEFMLSKQWEDNKFSRQERQLIMKFVNQNKKLINQQHQQTRQFMHKGINQLKALFLFQYFKDYRELKEDMHMKSDFFKNLIQSSVESYRKILLEAIRFSFSEFKQTFGSISPPINDANSCNEDILELQVDMSQSSFELFVKSFYFYLTNNPKKFGLDTNHFQKFGKSCSKLKLANLPLFVDVLKEYFYFHMSLSDIDFKAHCEEIRNEIIENSNVINFRRLFEITLRKVVYPAALSNYKEAYSKFINELYKYMTSRSRDQLVEQRKSNLSVLEDQILKLGLSKSLQLPNIPYDTFPQVVNQSGQCVYVCTQAKNMAIWLPGIGFLFSCPIEIADWNRVLVNGYKNRLFYYDRGIKRLLLQFEKAQNALSRVKKIDVFQDAENLTHNVNWISRPYAITPNFKNDPLNQILLSGFKDGFNVNNFPPIVLLAEALRVGNIEFRYNTYKEFSAEILFRFSNNTIDPINILNIHLSNHVLDRLAFNPIPCGSEFANKKPHTVQSNPLPPVIVNDELLYKRVERNFKRGIILKNNQKQTFKTEVDKNLVFRRIDVSKTAESNINAKTATPELSRASHEFEQARLALEGTIELSNIDGQFVFSPNSTADTFSLFNSCVDNPQVCQQEIQGYKHFLNSTLIAHNEAIQNGTAIFDEDNPQIILARIFLAGLEKRHRNICKSSDFEDYHCQNQKCDSNNMPPFNDTLKEKTSENKERKKPNEITQQTNKSSYFSDTIDVLAHSSVRSVGNTVEYVMHDKYNYSDFVSRLVGNAFYITGIFVLMFLSIYIPDNDKSDSIDLGLPNIILQALMNLCMFLCFFVPLELSNLAIGYGEKLLRENGHERIGNLTGYINTFLSNFIYLKNCFQPDETREILRNVYRLLLGLIANKYITSNLIKYVDISFDGNQAVESTNEGPLELNEEPENAQSSDEQSIISRKGKEKITLFQQTGDSITLTSEAEATFSSSGVAGSSDCSMDLLSTMKNRGGKVNDTHWYSDTEIDKLFKAYISGNSKVEYLDAMLATNISNRGNILSDNLKQFNTARYNAIAQNSVVKDRVLIPINLNQNHWALLYINYSKDAADLHTIYYFDPFGNEPSDELKGALQKGFSLSRLSDVNIIPITRRVQNDGYNCGPWIVEAARAIAQNGSVPEESFAINQARTEHMKIICPDAYPQESIKEELNVGPCPKI